MPVPATAFPAPGCTGAARPRPENTRPRPERCSAHRVRPDRPHRPRSRPVFGPPLRQLASDPSVPVEGGSANDYDYCSADPVNCNDLDGLAERGNKNVRDTGLRDVTDDEVKARARDTSIPKVERERYKTEEKARGLRHRGPSNFSRVEGFVRRNADRAAGAAGAVAGAWVAAKVLSPACGPALPVCAVVL